MLHHPYRREERCLSHLWVQTKLYAAMKQKTQHLRRDAGGGTARLFFVGAAIDHRQNRTEWKVNRECASTWDVITGITSIRHWTQIIISKVLCVPNVLLRSLGINCFFFWFPGKPWLFVMLAFIGQKLILCDGWASIHHLHLKNGALWIPCSVTSPIFVSE